MYSPDLFIVENRLHSAKQDTLKVKFITFILLFHKIEEANPAIKIMGAPVTDQGAPPQQTWSAR
jgi:hypothetical protein